MLKLKKIKLLQPVFLFLVLLICEHKINTSQHLFCVSVTAEEFLQTQQRAGLSVFPKS